MSDFEDSETNGKSSQDSEFDGIRILGAERASDIVKDDYETVEEETDIDHESEFDQEENLSHGSLDQHWTDPPTGQVPAILIDDSKDTSFEEISARTAVWRTEHDSDENDEDLDLGFITEDVPVIKDHNEEYESDESGITDDNPESVNFDQGDVQVSVGDHISSKSQPAYRDFDELNSDEDSELSSENMDRISRRRASELKAKKKSPKKPSIQKKQVSAKHELSQKAPSGSNISLRILTGMLVAGIAALMFYSGTELGLLLVIILALMAILEFNTAILKVGFRPAGVVAVFGVLASVLGAYLRGTPALLSMLGLTVGTIFAWYIFSDSEEKHKERPVANIGVTFLGFIWIGFFASFAGLILSPNQYPNKHGIAYLVAVIILAVVNDVGAFAFGKRFGAGKNHLFAKNISPHKTWEGFFGGTVLTLIVGAVIGYVFSPWTMSHAMEMAVLVSIFSPLGDLIESMLKRDLKLKDFGSVLPGHGGILDRIDGILLCLPMAYVYFQLMHFS